MSQLRKICQESRRGETERERSYRPDGIAVEMHSHEHENHNNQASAEIDDEEREDIRCKNQIS
jgi:hypothetical protein